MVQPRSGCSKCNVWGEERCVLDALPPLIFLHFTSILLSPAPALLVPTSDAYENGPHPSPWIWSAKKAQIDKSG